MAYDTPWVGNDWHKLYLQSGQFTSTLKTSRDVSGIDINTFGISWDGTNTPWCGTQGDKLYLQSGQFLSTLKTSRYIGGVDIYPYGISWDGINTPWTGQAGVKLYLQSGQFTSTIKTSRSVSGIDIEPTDISWDGTNTPWCGYEAYKLYLQSGQFTSTLKTSWYALETDKPQGISWDGTNTPWCGPWQSKLYLQSGHFTSTIKISQPVGSIDGLPMGIDTNDINGRLSLPPFAPTGVNASSLGTTITITWDPVDGVDSYNIYWSNSPGVTKENGTKITDATSPYTHDNLTYGKFHYYVITAENIAGESDESGEVNAIPYMLEGVTDVNCFLMAIIDGTNTLLIGTSDGTSGEVYKFTNSTWISTGTLEDAVTVDKLIQAENGWIYAVTNPNGMVFRTLDGTMWIKCSTNIGYKGVLETNSIIQVID